MGGFNTISEENNILVIYPEGIDRHWNDGRFFNDSAQANDVGFLNALLDSLLEEFNADPNQVFFTGISNGAMMSYRMAFEIPEKIAAIAPVAGSIPTDILPEDTSGHPVSVCVISGTRDPLVPWEGGKVGTKNNPRGTVISVPDSVQYWVERNNCDLTPESAKLPNTNILDLCRVYRDTYKDGDNGTEVVLYEIFRGGHTWPGGTQYFPKILIGRLCKDIDANKIIWEFFSSHPKI
jgi:polyhydroxybutyrate depolymerase